MKLIVSTFLVYKVKKCLLKSQPVTRASVAHQVGIGSPCVGQPLPILRATSTQTSDLFLGNILLILCDIKNAFLLCSK